MKKLRLRVDALQVEPFDVTPRGTAAKGTVVGQEVLITQTIQCQPSAGGSCDTGIPICVYCRNG